MARERLQQHTDTSGLNDKYYVEKSRVLDLRDLVDNLGYGARTRYDRENSQGFMYLLEDNRVETEVFERGFGLNLEERHRRIDDTIRRYRNSGDDKLFGVIKRQLPAKVQRLTVSVLQYTASEQQTLTRTRHQLSWTPESKIAIGRKLVTASLSSQPEAMVSARNFGEYPVRKLGSDPSRPYLMPEEVSDTTFEELEQEVYNLVARVRFVV